MQRGLPRVLPLRCQLLQAGSHHKIFPNRPAILDTTPCLLQTMEIWDIPCLRIVMVDPNRTSTSHRSSPARLSTPLASRCTRATWMRSTAILPCSHNRYSIHPSPFHPPILTPNSTCTRYHNSARKTLPSAKMLDIIIPAMMVEKVTPMLKERGITRLAKYARIWDWIIDVIFFC